MFEDPKARVSRADPMSWDNCLSHFGSVCPTNMTLVALEKQRKSSGINSEDLPVSSEWAEFLSSVTVNSAPSPWSKIKNLADSWLGERNYIPLNTNDRHGTMSLALYAGDGFVLKITANNAIGHELRPVKNITVTFPLVLPAIISTTIQNGTFVELYPWIDPKEITECDVSEIKKELYKLGLEFKAGDDSKENIGKLPLGQLCVLDSDAVKVREEKSNAVLEALNMQKFTWLSTVMKNFKELYNIGEESPKEHLKAYLSNPPKYKYSYPEKKLINICHS